MDFSNYKFRCHSVGKLMFHKGELTAGNKTYLLELFIEAVEGARKKILSKYFDKGIFCEEDAIDLLCQTIYKGKLLVKNKERKINDYLSGECDLAINEFVYDIKNAWDRITFGKADLTPEYDWQLRSYMWLWDKPKARLFYALNNMPAHMMVNEQMKMFYAGQKEGKYVTMESDKFKEDCETLEAFHNYDELPLWERFKVWEIEHDEAKINHMKKCLDAARVYLHQLWEEKKSSITENMKLMNIPLMDRLKYLQKYSE